MTNQIDNRSLKERVMELLLKPAYFLNQYFFYSTRLALAASRGSLSAATRDLDASNPLSWEFSAFSQNGEDGIIDRLLTLLRNPNGYFMEIGSSDGLENNTSYLALIKKYNGLMVEGNTFNSRYAKRHIQPHCLGVDFLNIYVNSETAPGLLESSRYLDPDFFSLDIDGLDYYVASTLFERGFRPKLVCVEYNSAFGPELSVTIPDTPTFNLEHAHPSLLYYGVSLTGWRNFFKGQGYEFVTVESGGVNAFFVDPTAVESEALQEVHGLGWRENHSQLKTFGCEWSGQYEQIKDMPFETIP